MTEIIVLCFGGTIFLSFSSACRYCFPPTKWHETGNDHFGLESSDKHIKDEFSRESISPFLTYVVRTIKTRHWQEGFRAFHKAGVRGKEFGCPPWGGVFPVGSSLDAHGFGHLPSSR